MIKHAESFLRRHFDKIMCTYGYQKLVLEGFLGVIGELVFFGNSLHQEVLLQIQTHEVNQTLKSALTLIFCFAKLYFCLIKFTLDLSELFF